MAIKIGSNIESIAAQRRLGESAAALSTTFERLSSGQRINRASDDAAGLSISSQLNAQGKILTQAVRNINDGISAVTISTAALSKLSDITTRQMELAEQSANGSYSSAQRQALNNETAALTQEYSRILATTKFNGINLFQTANVDLNIQVGADSSSNITASLGTALASGTAASAPANEVSTVDFSVTADSGVKQSVSFTANIDVQGKEFQALYAGIGASNDIAGGDYITFSYNNIGYYVWFTVDSGSGPAGSDPLAAGNGIQVDINSTDSASQVMDSVSNALTNASVINHRSTDVQNEFVEIRSTSTGDQVDPGTSYAGSFIGAYGTVDAAYNYLNDYVAFYGANNNPYYIYFDPSTSGPGGTGIYVELAGLDSPAAIAQKTVAALAGYSDFSASISGYGEVLITSSQAGKLSEPYNYSPDGSTQVSTQNQGSLLQSAQNYFTFSTSGGDYYAWFDDGVSGDPNLAAHTGIQVTGVGGIQPTTDLLASRAKIAIDAALPAAGITTTVNGSILTITNTATGARNDAVSHIAGLSIAINQGSSGSAAGTTIEPETLDLTSASGARSALTTLNLRLSKISSEIAIQGAYLSRFDIASNVLKDSVQNYAAAESRIKDADLAQEAADLIKLKISQDIGTSILSQANQIPQLALFLLKA